MSTSLQQPPPSSTVIPMRRRGAGFDPRKQAEMFARMLESLRLEGNCHHLEEATISNITQIASLTKRAGEQTLAARLYLELARALHALGRLTEADEFLQAAVKAGEYTGIDVIHEITRQRALVALDRDEIDEARDIISKADKLVLVKSATIVHDLSDNRYVTTKKDDSQAGEHLQEQGDVTPATALIEAEILMSAGDHTGVKRALAYVHQSLVKAEVQDRKVDDMATLGLLRTLSHDNPQAGAQDIISGLIDHWREKGASAPVIAKMYAAAAETSEELTLAINIYQRERFRRLGQQARTIHTPQPSLRTTTSSDTTARLTLVTTEPSNPASTRPLAEEEETSPLDLETEAGAAALATAASTTDEEEEESLLDLSGFTNEDIEELSNSIREAPKKIEVLAETETASTEDAQTKVPIFTGQIGPGALDLYSVINNLENSRQTGHAHFALKDVWARIYFQQGRIVFAAHHTEPEAPFEAFKLLCQWNETTEERIPVEFKPTDAVDAPLDLLSQFSSNAHLIICALTGEKDSPPEETHPDTTSFNESNAAPTASSIQFEVTTKLVNAINSIHDARDMRELTLRVTEHVAEMGAHSPRTQILMGERPVILASSSPDDEQPSAHTTLCEAPASTAGGIKVSIEAIDSPDKNYLPALSVIARTARAVAETLPFKPKTELAAQLLEEDNESGLVWRSSAMFDVISTVMQIAPMDGLSLPLANVLITGETGTGKDKLARHIHEHSGRRERKFFTVNCATIPKDLFASHIFGHRKGSFTGAHSDSPGLLEEADGSTIFFTEFAEVPLDVQAKLLTVLDTDGQYARIGEPHNIRKANCRFIFATNRNVHDHEIMRTDIFHRCPGKIHLKPLRERRDDIPELARHFAQEFDLNMTEAAVAFLQDLSWPGNVRELRNTLQMCTGIVAKGVPITMELVREGWRKASPPQEEPVDQPSASGVLPQLAEGRLIRELVETFEASALKEAYHRYGGKISEILRVSGMSRNSLTDKLVAYGIHRPRARGHEAQDAQGTSQKTTPSK